MAMAMAKPWRPGPPGSGQGQAHGQAMAGPWPSLGWAMARPFHARSCELRMRIIDFGTILTTCYEISLTLTQGVGGGPVVNLC